MSDYKTALALYLSDRSETDLAAAVGCTQATINRYKNGERFPKADVARQIERATDGAVPFDVWRSDFMRKAGVAA
jgi:transcriptional regulator with XRE-family HTH domain